MNMPSPAYNIICFGEILWDLLPTGAQPGGAPMNVAYHLRQLGQHPAIISRIGTDARGREMLEVLAGKKVVTSFVQQDDTYPTGIVHATPNEHHEMQYDIVQPVAWDFIAGGAEAEALVQAADYFVFGSLACRLPTSKNTLLQLLEGAKKKVFDINLRPPHYSQALAEELLPRASVLKMNEAELQLITGWYGNYATDEDRIAFMQDRFQIPLIIVTMGGDGAVVSDNGNLHRHGGYKVTVADTVGSGDSFLAAFLARTIAGASPEEALNFACALGALVASRTGGCPAYEVAEIEKIRR